jgi:hypothetical protein
MLRLKASHHQAFRRAALDDFEDRMVEHLREHFGDICRSMGEDAVRALIARGVVDAERYGITSKRGVCKYLNLAILFGPDFARTEPWAGPIIEDASIEDAEIRIDRLADAGVHALEEQERGEKGEE